MLSDRRQIINAVEMCVIVSIRVQIRAQQNIGVWDIAYARVRLDRSP